MEAYHITVHGPNLGRTNSIYIDIEVADRDECISVKSPSNNILIEDIICNQSGGMSIGSLTADITDLSLPTSQISPPQQQSPMSRCKIFTHTNAYDTTYAFDVDQYWYNRLTPNTGATVNGNTVVNQCNNVYGSRYCVGNSTGLPLATFTTSVTSTAAPTGFTAPAKPAWVVAGYWTNIPIPFYAPAALWKPVSIGVVGSVTAVKATSMSVPASTVNTSSSKFAAST
ncbi:pectin lyase fold/virulence factor [Rhexocercosporidium sp. MPI-PUGE-AT-0058]|nr:pectin lyase fold/virulence factor [Rhexocercosporidium sp. MPI-PUGE-AT-0058]